MKNRSWYTIVTIGAITGALAASPYAARAAPAAYPLIRVQVDGAALATRGILINARTLLPVRELTEQLGGVVRWDPQTKTIWAAFPDQQRTVRMMLGSPIADLFEYAPDDPHRTGRLIETRQLDQPPLLLGGRIVAPVAAAADVAQAKVFWEPKAKQVLIQSQGAERVGTAVDPLETGPQQRQPEPEAPATLPATENEGE